MEQKLERLRKTIADLESVGVAFSAGVDSTLLLAVAHEVLDDAVVAITAASPANPQREQDATRAFCTERGIRHVVLAVNELEISGFENNPPNRCYICKKHLFETMLEQARRLGLRYVVEGSNADDQNNYRPGHRALEELGVRSPLQECGLTKADVRALSRELGLPTWDKPSFACLYTRFPYGELITPEKVRRIDSAEQFLLDAGFHAVRVRLAGSAGAGEIARIEVAPSEVAALASSPLREQAVATLKDLGFTYVTLDLQGYRTGSMDEVL